MDESPILPGFCHRFLDRDKPYVATDLLTVDVDGDGLVDVVCGAWWYRNPTWERRDIPGIYQIVNASDLDGDGRLELIATRKSPAGDGYQGLSSEFCWLKPIDPVSGHWEEHPIGRGTGDWPHGTVVAPVLPHGRSALIAAYHSAYNQDHFPEVFQIPDDPRIHPWPKRVLAEVRYWENILPCDLTGDGKLDLVLGPWWLEALGDGSFQTHQIVADFTPARLAVADVDGDGRPDVVLCEQGEGEAGRLGRLAWFRQPENPRDDPWEMHLIDTIRYPHSISIADLDGDGEEEIVCGEHVAADPYSGGCCLFVYKKADDAGRKWNRHVIDDQFEHHVGAQVFEVGPGKLGIASHGWRDSRYVHLWEQQ